MKLDEIVRQALVSEGIAGTNWRFDVKVYKGGFNYCTLGITVYEPRCKKPSTVWEAPFDMTRNQLDWSKANLLYNKYC